MAKQEKFDFSDIPELFEDGNALDLTDDEVLEAIAKPEILGNMSKGEQVIYVAKMFIKLTGSDELKEKASKIIKEKMAKKT